MSILLRAAALGLATGGRSTFGLAALASTAGTTGSAPTSGWVKAAAGLAAAGELVADKLPQTPSRLSAPGLSPRLAFGGVAAAVLAHREGESRSSTAAAALIGMATALAGAKAGARWRAVAAGKFGSDLPGAVVEDATWLVTARLAAARA
jgi:uncharacterized membrane protein